MINNKLDGYNEDLQLNLNLEEPLKNKLLHYKTVITKKLTYFHYNKTVQDSKLWITLSYGVTLALFEIYTYQTFLYWPTKIPLFKRSGQITLYPTNYLLLIPITTIVTTILYIYISLKILSNKDTVLSKALFIVTVLTNTALYLIFRYLQSQV